MQIGVKYSAGGKPRRFLLWVPKEYNSRVKSATSGTAAWNAKENAWSTPLDPTIIRHVLQQIPDIEIHKELRMYLDSLMNKQKLVSDIAVIDDPLDVTCRLYPFQRASVRVLDTAKRMILGHEPGLGKTPILCSTLDYSGCSVGRNLIVCPSSVKWSWVSHLREWAGIDDIVVVESQKVDAQDVDLIYRDHKKKLSHMLTNEEAKTIVIGYEMMRKLSKTLEYADYDSIIFDESHRIKNRKALTTQAAQRLQGNSAHIWLATGTPVRKDYDDLFTQLSMVDPDRFTSYWNFAAIHLDTVRNHFGGTDIVGLKDKQGFNAMMSSYLYQKRKVDVLPELPEKIYTPMEIPMVNTQDVFYRKLEKEARVLLTDGTPWTSQSVLEKIMALRQAALCPSIIGGPAGSAKLQVINELVEDLMSSGEQFLIFTCFRGFLDLLGELLYRKKVPTGVIHGGTYLLSRDTESSRT